MARIVYEGVGGGGDLFAGMKFHVHQRVPMRNTLLQQIEANGGELQPLEKGADIIIADCARQDAPPGSISWKFIAQSVKKGELQDMESFPASKIPRRTNGAAAARVSAVASPSSSRQIQTQPRRTGRTPFTHEDDQVLMKFCARKEKLGGSLKGNAIFQELEQLNPRHTYQSWRDRWVKYLQDKPRLTLDSEEEEEEDEEEEEEVEPSPPRSAPRPKAPKPAPVPQKMAPAKATSKSSSKAPAPVRPKTEPAKITSQSPATKPTPKPQKVEPARPAPKSSATKAAAKPRKAGSLSRTSTRPSSATPVESRAAVSKHPAEERPYVEMSAAGNNFTDEETQLLLDVHDAILNVDEDQMIDAWIAWAVAHPTHTPQEWRNYFNKEVKGKNVPEEQIFQDPPPARPSVSPPRPVQSKDKGKGRAKDDNPVLLRSSREIKDSQGSSNNTIKSPENITATKSIELTMEEKFNANLSDTMEHFHPDRFPDGLNFEPEICDIPVSLFEIWTVAMDMYGGFTEIDEHEGWSDFAAGLGFVEEELENAGRELKIISDHHFFPDFEGHLREYHTEMSDSQANEMADDQLLQTTMQAAQISHSSAREEEEQDDNDNVDAPQSSPYATLSVKRIRTSTTTPARKRQKIDKGKGRARETSEIPSTPEDIINSHKRQSPSKSSPLKQVPIQAGDFSEEEEDEEGSPSLFIPETKDPPRSKPAPKLRKLSPKPRKPSPKLPKPDPYTQDFSFGDSLPREDDQQEEEDEGQHVEVSPTPARKKALPIHSSSNNDQSSLSTTAATKNSDPSQNTTSTQSQTDLEKQQDLRTYTEYCMSLGYDYHDVGKAILSTSLIQGALAMRVMQSLKEGKGIPEDEREVWTEMDDVVLKTYLMDKEGTKRKFGKLLKKHGMESVKQRRKFLKEMESED